MFAKSSKHHFAIFIVTLAVGLAGVLGHAVWLTTQQIDRPKPTLAFHELPVDGFHEVVSASDGDVIATEGFIDIKDLCIRSDAANCETHFGRGPEWEHIPIRLRLCDHSVKTNCITKLKTPVDFRDVWVQDRYGNQIDFDGAELLEEPNTWTSKDQRLRIRGRVTVVNGVGRFLEPVEIVEALP